MEAELTKKRVEWMNEKGEIKYWYNLYLELNGKKIQIQAKPYKKKDGTLDNSNNKILTFMAEEE